MDPEARALNLVISSELNPAEPDWGGGGGGMELTAVKLNCLPGVGTLLSREAWIDSTISGESFSRTLAPKFPNQEEDFLLP